MISEMKYVKANTQRFSISSIAVLLLVGAMIGLSGQTGQSIVFYTSILLATAFVELSILSSVWLLNRVCRSCREALVESPTGTAAFDVDPRQERLKSTVDSMRCEEAACAERYALRRSSSDELIRAKSLRIQAEIELLRHDAMPKSWAEACQHIQA